MAESNAVDVNAIFRRVSFVGESTARVKSLSGWKKTHSPPDPTSSRDQAYIASISASELKQDLDAVYEALKRAFGFKRRELSVAEPADGTGTIIAPFFSYSISISLSPADATEVIWTRTVDSITEPQAIISDAFAEVFDGVFRTLQFALPTPIDVENCIDTIEDVEIAGLNIDYDRDATYCNLRFAESTSTIKITADTLAIVELRPAKISTLLNSLRTMQTLVREHNLPMDWISTT